MIDKEIFLEIKNLKRECQDLEERLKKEENRVVTDSVRGSSSSFPYTEHSYVIEGIQDTRQYKRYKKMLKNKKKELGKKILNFEYQLNSIDDAEIREMLRHKYIDGLKNYQIADVMNHNQKKEYTADAVRMKINRFFEKN